MTIPKILKWGLGLAAAGTIVYIAWPTKAKNPSDTGTNDKKSFSGAAGRTTIPNANYISVALNPTKVNVISAAAGKQYVNTGKVTAAQGCKGGLMIGPDANGKYDCYKEIKTA